MSKKSNPFLDNDKLFDTTKSKVENDAVLELSNPSKKIAEKSKNSTVENTVVKKDKNVSLAEKPVHPILQGQRDKTIVVYRTVLDLLRLLKLTRPDCDINETANELILDGLESRGWLKDLQKQQAILKK